MNSIVFRRLTTFSFCITSQATRSIYNFTNSLGSPTPQSHIKNLTLHSLRGQGIMTDSSSVKGASSGSPIRFHTFDVSNQVFLERKHTIGIVNLMPIAPLHVLLIPRNPHHRLVEIPKDELADLFDAVQDVSQVVQRLTNSPACTVAIQDGKESGQSVPHLHVHVIPRKDGDFTPNDIIYSHLENFGLKLHKDMHKNENGSKPDQGLAPDPDQERKPRSAKEMSNEANWIRQNFK